ncbi:MAG: hypothetical protein MUC76_08280 [Spirochaetes bacterium]|jgi:hypothetical protein|nr:hypothetical protein [Spirochaetota bacterium]
MQGDKKGTATPCTTGERDYRHYTGIRRLPLDSTGPLVFPAGPAAVFAVAFE